MTDYLHEELNIQLLKRDAADVSKFSPPYQSIGILNIAAV